MIETSPMPESRLLIIGIGNEYRCDDGAGLIVARRLRSKLSDEFEVQELSGEGVELMEAWRDAGSVILIDAVQSGAAAGSIHRIDAHAQPLPQSFFHYSSHSFGLAEAIEMARALNRLPRRLIVYGIEGNSFEAGIGLSEEVKRAIVAIEDKILAEIPVMHPDLEMPEARGHNPANKFT